MNYKRNKQQLNLLCGKDKFRPELNYLKVTPENVVGTDACILGVYPTAEIFNSDFIEQIPEEGFLVSSKDWAWIFKHDNFYLDFKKSLLISKSKKGESCCIIKSEKEIGKFPEWQHLIPSGECESISQIGIDFTLAAKLQKALGFFSSKIEFRGMNKLILVTDALNDDTETYGLIAPVILGH